MTEESEHDFHRQRIIFEVIFDSKESLFIYIVFSASVLAAASRDEQVGVLVLVVDLAILKR